MVFDILFYTGLALLLTHELDAVQRHEWRIFPLLSNLEEGPAYQLFVIAHVPLFVLMFWLLAHPSESVRYWFQVGIDGFLVVHLGLHHLFKSHARNEFSSAFSRVLINLMAAVGALHLVMLLGLR